MVWDNTKDEMLCREVLLFEPYQFKPRSRERGNAWKAISENLTACSSNNMNFKVDARAVRERVGVIIVKHKQKSRAELVASGISPDHTALDDALEEISEKMKEAEEVHTEATQEKTQKIQQDALKAKEMRQQALETLGETMKRKPEVEDPTSENRGKKKSRSSGSETLVYLREKAEKDKELKLNEMELRRQELQLRKQEIENTKYQQNQMFEHLHSQNNQLFLLLASKHQNEQSKE